jgi:cob(I)alamin adenosyltransferase
MKTKLKSANPIKKGRKGLNIFYYGKGKGKTTAVIGLAARAAGAGMNVCILQFVKAKKPKAGAKLQSGEWPISNEFNFFDAARAVVKAAQGNKGKQQNNLQHKIGRIDYKQLGAGFVGILGDKKQRALHVKEAKKGLAHAKQIIKSDKYDLVILDELVSALEINLLTEKEILDLLSKKPKHLHLAYTGHDHYDKIVEASDLVSDIVMIKHPYYSGILAQRGIDF